jgi:uncharacterized alpha-E superfamily protein
MNFIHDTLGILCDAHSREIERQAGELHARLHYGRTDDIMEFGLHEYLMEFLEHISELGAEVSRTFLVPTSRPSADPATRAPSRLRAISVRATDALR